MLHWIETKHFIEHSVSISTDSLHVVVGVLVQLGAAVLFSNPISSWRPWLAVLVLIGVNELIDLRFPQWPDPTIQWGETAKDVLLTMFLPTVLLLTARQFPRLYDARARSARRGH